MLMLVSPLLDWRVELVPQAPSMASDGLPARETGPWVNEKKYYLERYLTISTKGVGPKWNGKLAYVDLFSGPGRSIIRGSGEEVDGSPLVALTCSFASYVFVDTTEVLATLKQRLRNHPRFLSITFIPGDCNEVIEKVRAALPPDHLTLAFVDPTGLQIHFSTIQRLVTGRSVDLLMTIQFGMGILMNLHQYSRSDGETLTAFLGDDSWRADVKAGATPSAIGHRILDRYLNQLRKLGYDTVADREIPIRNDQNLLLYFMVLASRHPRGHDFWKKATEIAPSGQRKLGL
jgi:three-Cys-motif partner protein